MYVHCGDTDIVVLQIDLVAHQKHKNGRGWEISRGKRIVNISERVEAIGREKVKGL